MPDLPGDVPAKAIGSLRFGPDGLLWGAAWATIFAMDPPGLTPRDLATNEVERVQRAMVRSDAALLGVENVDPDDLTLAGRAHASSTLRRLAVETPSSTVQLESDLGVVLPVDPVISTLDLLLDAEADTELTLELHSTGKPQNYLPAEHLKTSTAPVAAGRKVWVRFELDWAPGRPQNAFIVLRANPVVSLHCSTGAEPGTLFFRRRRTLSDVEYTEQWREWKYLLYRESFCYRLESATAAFDVQHVIGGYARPYGGPQMWVSESLERDAQPWVELTWDDPKTFREVALIFNDEVDEDLINLHHHRTPFDVIPELVRDYKVLADVDGTWTTIVAARDNRWRHRVHDLDTAVTTARLRLVIESTNGAPYAHVVAVRVYAQRR